ncbi:hypothetical protein RYX56_21035 [Alkalihalophilus lindianensis]|uniref:Uncharacterized protein n=1 Tax=Alkalihalophilus lindianensis TaxID=1630542 RepID=A0ABU3XG15_9BACI|nr:hypothetical protein [Alkalihalophilus lindianensis]MDV2686846.1 hypothetical protein [Alkalihalophilus lindianensis]
MTDPTNREILEELKAINQKLDEVNERAKKPKGLSTPMAIIALVLGFSVLGPMISMLFVLLFDM